MKNKVSILIISLLVSSLFVTAQANSEAPKPGKQKTITLFDAKNQADKKKMVVKSTDLAPDSEISWSVQKTTTPAGVQIIEVNNGKLSFQIIPSLGMAIQKVVLGDQNLAWNSPAINNKPASLVELVVDQTKPYKITIKGKVEEASTNAPNLITEISTVPGESTFHLSNTFDFGNMTTKAVAAEEPTIKLADLAKSAQSWEPSFTEWSGKQAPDFTITDITGKKTKVSDYRGKNLILNVWATWCPPCRKEIPDFIELRKEISEDELAIVGISTEDGQDSKVKDFVKENKMNYTISVADFTKLDAPYSKISAIPTTFFIDKEGKIKFATIGVLTLKDTKNILKAK
ncbi:MAG: redoxin domain-containing protein [Sedimentisphaerales bacterium]|nr:redoxin domain-containing protein [Sedimentisphaerales bacterium]